MASQGPFPVEATNTLPWRSRSSHIPKDGTGLLGPHQRAFPGLPSPGPGSSAVSNAAVPDAFGHLGAEGNVFRNVQAQSEPFSEPRVCPLVGGG